MHTNKKDKEIQIHKKLKDKCIEIIIIIINKHTHIQIENINQILNYNK